MGVAVLLVLIGASTPLNRDSIHWPHISDGKSTLANI